ncbi:MAG: RNA ligase [Cyanobacteria bacterium J06649_11]
MAEITFEQIKTTWGIHPVRRIAFKELYQGLLENVRVRNLVRVVDGDLEIFNYTTHAQYNANWNRFTLIARGLVVDIKKQVVIATPFPKFFNYGEAKIWGADKVDGEVLVYEKYDGSLGIVFYDGVKWRVTTRGSFDSDAAIWGQRWFDENIDTDLLEVGNTYVFEIIYLGNRVVVAYDFQGMVLLTAYDVNGWEYNRERIEVLADELKIKVTQAEKFESIDKLIQAAANLDRNSEGWVVRFANGHRLKVKGVEYCRLHRVASQVTPLAIWEILKEDDDIEAIRMELAEEDLQEFDRIRLVLLDKLDFLVERIIKVSEQRQYLSDKDVGLALNKGEWSDGQKVSEIERKFLFAFRKQDFLDNVAKGGHRCRRMAFEFFRPAGNLLDIDDEE